MKEVLEVAAAVAGLLTAIMPLIARFIDYRKRSARLARRAQRARFADRPAEAIRDLPILPAAKPSRPLAPEPVLLELAEEEYDDEPVVDVHRVQRAQSLVKAPAIALMITGVLGLGFNLFIAGFGFIDEFVTPLSSETRARQAAPPSPDERPRRSGDPDEQTSAVIGFVTLLILSVPCAMAVWAGFNMIRLRSYWLSVAGSIAIMPGACFCCLAGFPVGIWALVILFRPEVSSAFT